ncbi:hypothetical protein EBS80_02640 [bacterium]|nr:hypothetical protein [bacterium]
MNSYVVGENPTQQTALRLRQVENNIAVALFGKSTEDTSDQEHAIVERVKALMTDTERLRFPQMTRQDLSQLSLDVLARYEEQQS